ncbi:hypothetical protein BDR26DRAFT_898736 [Obelidium mucronatum]|nr:hypothetical protein BDR26DRAFT_898736 [Obelidium mucronatum]
MNEPTDSRTTLTLNQSERKFNLPAELVEQIILYLPIDQHLQSIALASRLFGQSILNNHFLANAHLKQSIAHVELKRWRLVVPIELARKDWFHLPFVYKCALYAWYSVNGPPVKLYDLPLYPSLYLRLHTWLMDTHPHVKMNLGYLAKAISDGNLEIARDCLARVEDREFLKGFRCVPILRALRQGSKKTADVLMQLVELAPFVHNGNTLVAASEGNHTLLVRELLASQLSETYILSHGRLAVQKAALSGALDAITALLEDPRIHDDDDNEALCCALKEGHSDIAWRFMQRSNFMPTANVFQNSSTDREIRFILNHPRMDFSTVDCISGLISHHWMTSTPRHTHLVELLKSDKADPTLNDNLAIISAAKYGLQDIVDLLLQDSRVDPGAQNNKALVEACSGRFCKLDVVASLLRHPRVDPGPLLSNPMYFNHIFDAACSIGNVALVKQCLLQDNTDLSASNCMSSCSSKHAV